jgi:hypothetical protein
VYSSLEDVRKYPGVTEKLPEIKSAPGRYVGHWEAKAEVEVPLGSLPTAFSICPSAMAACVLASAELTCCC